MIPTRYKGYFVTDDGSIYSSLSDKLLKPAVNAKGYLRVAINTDQGRRSFYVHRLVCEAVHGPCPEGMECSHLDGDPSNNSPENLKWETPSENQSRREQHGTKLVGEQATNNKLTESEVNEIRELDRSGMYRKDIASKYGVHPSQITRICNNQNWSHIE